MIGNPVQPVVKITANPQTAASMADHIDIDVYRSSPKDVAGPGGEMWSRSQCRTCIGPLSGAEALGHREFVMTRLHRTA